MADKTIAYKVTSEVFGAVKKAADDLGLTVEELGKRSMNNLLDAYEIKASIHKGVEAAKIIEEAVVAAASVILTPEVEPMGEEEE